jgi:hypothetical protein
MPMMRSRGPIKPNMQLLLHVTNPTILCVFVIEKTLIARNGHQASSIKDRLNCPG